MKTYTTLLACILLLYAGCGQNRDTASKDKVRELLTLTEVDKFIDVGMQMGIHPDDPDRLIKEELVRGFDREEFISRCSAVYAKHFTDDELDDLIRFYRTDTGKKIVRVMPAVMKEIVQVSQQIAEETIARLEEKEGSQFHKQKQKTDALICRNNLRMIDAAKEMAALELALSNGSAVTEKQISGHIKDGFSSLKCPSGGTYEIGLIGKSPTCTVTSHALPELSFTLPGFAPVTQPSEQKKPEKIVEEFCAGWRLPLASIEKKENVFRVHLEDGRIVQLDPGETEPKALRATLQRVGRVLSSSQGEAATVVDARDSDRIIAHKNALSENRTTEDIPAIYVIQPGDTLSGIAKKCDTSISEIKKLNHLDSNNIRAGDTLTLPKQ
jgi:hypothetical protein